VWHWLSGLAYARLAGMKCLFQASR